MDTENQLIISFAQLCIYVKCQSVFKVSNMQSRKGLYVGNDEKYFLTKEKKEFCQRYLNREQSCKGKRWV